MGTLSKNINFVWYGDNCESCSDFSFYSGTDLNSSFRGVLKVTDIKQGGYVYSAWSSEVHAENLKEFEKLPDIVKNTLGADYLKNGQGFDKFDLAIFMFFSFCLEFKNGVTYMTGIIRGPVCQLLEVLNSSQAVTNFFENKVGLV